MSARFTTVTPFVNQTFLEQALKECGIEYSIQNGNLILRRSTQYGSTHAHIAGDGFYKNQRGTYKYTATGESLRYRIREIGKALGAISWTAIVAESLLYRIREIEKAYNNAEKRHKEELRRLEEEFRRRQEEERKRQLELERKQALDEIKKEQEAINEAIRKLDEEVRRRQEEERILAEQKKALVEEEKQKILEKAKAMGYSVKQKQKGNNIQLILVRNT